MLNQLTQFQYQTLFTSQDVLCFYLFSDLICVFNLLLRLMMTLEFIFIQLLLKIQDWLTWEIDWKMELQILKSQNRGMFQNFLGAFFWWSAFLVKCCGKYFKCFIVAPISQIGQTHSNNLSAVCRRIVWLCLTILWYWCLRG